MVQQPRKTVTVQYHNGNGKLRTATLHVEHLPKGDQLTADGHGQDRWPEEIWSWFMDQAKEKGLMA